MGYIRFNKAGTAYDLLPAANITNVTSSGDTNCVIEYGNTITHQDATNPECLRATIVITTGVGSAAEIRLRVNNAIASAVGDNVSIVDLRVAATGVEKVITSTTWSGDVF